MRRYARLRLLAIPVVLCALALGGCAHYGRDGHYGRHYDDHGGHYYGHYEAPQHGHYDDGGYGGYSGGNNYPGGYGK